jgi:hypothetical protein
MRNIAALYVMRKSVYFGFEGVDCYDEKRDARTWPGGCPVVAHPPCRLWSRMRGLSTAPSSEKELARHAVDCVRKHGGVLEHPCDSLLWKDKGLPLPGKGGLLEYTMAAPQFWFGAPYMKWTWFFICGVPWGDLPDIPFRLGYPECTVSSSRRKSRIAACPTSKRARTCPLLGAWLVEVARRSII